MKKSVFFPCAGLLVLMLANINVNAADEAPRFPDVSHATRKEGSFVNSENLANLRPGLSKTQVYELIGAPHFHEGIFRVKEWNYVLNFRNGEQVRACQFQIRFDDHMNVENIYWKDPSCAEKK